MLPIHINRYSNALQKTNDEQYRRIQKTEHALQVAEEELLRVQLEATAKSKELSQAHGAWFPPWLATHANYYKELATTHWKEHGQPVLDVLLQKVSKKSIQAQQFMESHFESSKAKWMFLVSSTEPYVQTVSSKAVEVYHTSKSAMSSHIAKVQEISDPYFQAAKRFSQPYVKQFATITKPHVEKVRVTFSPYSDCVIHAYGKFLELATTYHQQYFTCRFSPRVFSCRTGPFALGARVGRISALTHTLRILGEFSVLSLLLYFHLSRRFLFTMLLDLVYAI
ncbi:uncharacterized protein LOC121972382 [Zingiber officinale]|uniref:uncharacterized protein LOC121972382 n=1 Tax=Zingiber officinale TaxID=94328 RepID=UPI001C4CF1E4|nr:uncharacterized protein LOC121972382 [Zingiber officinale]